jgi:large subunit ribosomal protein L29
MKSGEIRGLTTAELKRKLEESRGELMNLRFQMSTGSLKDFTRLEQTRRNIARMTTILNEKLASESEGAG